MKHLRQRLERLEKLLAREPILLQLPDGNIEKIGSDPNAVLDLMMNGLNGLTVAELELMARSIGSVEPGGSHMVDVARLLYHSKTTANSPENHQANQEMNQDTK